MKNYITAAVLCFCLLFGSMYPRLILEHHVKLVGQDGQELAIEGDYQKDIPVKFESGVWNFIKSFYE